MEDRQRLIEDRKALRDAIKRALAVNDKEEVERLEEDLSCVDNYLKETTNEQKKMPRFKDKK